MKDILPLLSLESQTVLPLPSVFIEKRPPAVAKSSNPLECGPINGRYNLKESQAQALINAVEYPFSIAHGPSASGKSHILAVMMHHVLGSQVKVKETILTCATTNVAVDALMEKVMELLRKLKSTATTVRMFSEMQISADYTSRASRLSHPRHIQGLRIAFAQSQFLNYGKFLVGVRTLESHGVITDPDQFKAYHEDRRKIEAALLKTTEIVFCTCLEAHLQCLQGWATFGIIDESGCAKPFELLLVALSSSRMNALVFAGDPYQLGPVILSETAREIWTKTVLEQNINKGQVTVLLNCQYWTHSDGYRHTSMAIYKGKVSSYHQTSNPRPFLSNLLRSFPISIPIPNMASEFTLTKWGHCINVDYGITETLPKGSSYN